MISDVNKKEPFEGQVMFSLLTLDAIMASGFECDYDTYAKGKQLIEDCTICTLNSMIKINVPILKYFTRHFPNSALSQKFNDRLYHNINNTL